MAKKAIGGALILIGAYLFLVNYNGAVADTNAASNGGVGLVKALQGR